MSTHPPDAAVLHALGALEPDEAVALEEHVAACLECRRELESSRETAGNLALLADPVAPGKALRQKILAAAAGLPQAIPLVGERSRHRPLRRRRRREATRALASERRFLDELVGPVRSYVPLVAARRGVRARAHLYLAAEDRAAGLVVAGLPDPGEGVYQLWLIAGGQPVPVEAFRPDATGQALVPLRRRLRAAEGFAISLEHTPNPPSPLGPIMLRSA